MRLAATLGIAAALLGTSALDAQSAMRRTEGTPAADPLAAERIKPFQYLYGSAEAGALSVQAYHELLEYARRQVRHRPRESVVLARDATLEHPHFLPCGTKPFAAVFDVDETAILNLGLESWAAAGRPTGGGATTRWAQTGGAAVAPVPGALSAIDALRKMGVTVIFNSNRGADSAEGTADQIAAAGFGRPVHGKTLYLAGDDSMGARKDGRRWTIAARYCVITLAGDQLVDISDLFNPPGISLADRRRMATHGWMAQMWGNGWFVLPNPVYGSGLRGTYDEIFPADKRWSDPRAGAR